MPKLSDVRKRFLAEATSRYAKSLPGSDAERFLVTRGLAAESIAEEVSRFRLGYVAEPLPGHEQYKGMLAIPYLRWSPGCGWSVVSIRFRCIVPHCAHEFHGKYNTVAGDTPRIYNTVALLRSDDRIAICEGEIDAITANVCGIPAVGIAGVKTWKDHFREPFLGYEVVYLLADGDNAGMEFANKLAKILPNSKILPCSNGEDVNSEVVKHGKSYLLERVKE